jgi:hypothetical protein
VDEGGDDAARTSMYSSCGVRPLIQSQSTPYCRELSQNQGLLVPHSQSVRGQAAPERFCK